MGYTADHAKDGLEVLELCERAALADSLYDVILLDIQMPNMDVCAHNYTEKTNDRDMKQRGYCDRGMVMMFDRC